MTKYYISSTKYSISERQTKRGKVLDVVFRIVDKDGKEKQKRLCGYANKSLAKQAYIDFITENCVLLKNNPIRREHRCASGRETLTISMLSSSYFSAIRNQIKDSTIYEKQKIFALFFIPRFGEYELKSLTKEELFIWQDELWSAKNPRTNEYYSYKYLSKVRTYFSAFLSWCAERYDGFTNNLLQIKKPKRRVPKTTMQFWTRDEFDQFISKVDNQTYHTLFMMLFFTGRRKGEVLALSSEDITTKGIIFDKSITRKTLTDSPYEITSTKTERVSSTPICVPLQEELNCYKAPIGRFFFGGDSPISDNTLRRAFNNYSSLAGVKQIRIHDLRHSFVSMLIHLGANLTVVADLIGDTLAQVTKTYAHLYDEDKNNIILRIR